MASVDKSIHPTASGRALKTVEEHSRPAGSDELVFYAGWFCPFVQRVWLALEEKHIPYQYKEENPYKKDADFLEVSPKGLVPAIKWRGKPLHESLVILNFLEDAYADTPPLLPKDPYARAQAALAIDHVSKAVVPAFYRLLQRQDAEEQADARTELEGALRRFGEMADVEGPFFAGGGVGMADLVCAPWVARFPILEKHRGWDASGISPRFSRWMSAITARPAYVATLSEPERYEEVYGRYLRDESHSAVAQSTRAGRDLP
ncbi:glutathione S-transferase [Calocera cornea HHB12733]|uniref:Glutathione-dependent dehydroascorbate reductase n=1 Tax=Calocera cornea HHB12733 TaxID=1353952 RepID=A0A165KBL6_9BASI|nr:glutathione S-transferase [Calocera cornea HHB12733]